LGGEISNENNGEMNVMMPDDRERERIRSFWQRIERCLRSYSRHSLVRTLGLTNREGLYLFLATWILAGLVFLVSSPAISNWWAYVAATLAGCYIVDAVLVNTTTTFITQRPIHRLRSVLLTLHNLFNVGIAYAVLYAGQGVAFQSQLTAVQAIYFSLVTLTTVGYGDIHPGTNAGVSVYRDERMACAEAGLRSA